MSEIEYQSALTSEVGGYMTESPGDGEWLSIARNTYNASTDWFDSSVRQDIEDSYARFRNQHPAGSKYHKEEFQKRSRIFRPKTRTVIRNNEAAGAVAAFATEDVVHCSAPNKSDPKQRLAASVHQALINDRLKTDVPWYTIFNAGVQEAQVAGIVISKQTWDYREREVTERVRTRDVMTGEEFTRYETKTEVIADRPHIELRPVELVRFDQGCDWTDPVGTSPYIIDIQPWYIGRLKARMKGGPDESKGKVQFRKLPDGILSAAVKHDWDSIRQAREGDRLDRYQADGDVHDYMTVWVREYIVERDDGDWIFYTLDDLVLLSDPVPIEDVYKHGRPYSVGSAIIEAHRFIPESLPSLLSGLQESANELGNLRIDNVRLAMNGRYFVTRGRGVDIRTLVRNVPASAVMVGGPNDVKWERPTDISRSAYEEQDRINTDFDDLAGSFSSSSVATNKNLNQTVGGMEMLQSPANNAQEYMLRTIVETWAEPALRQLIKLASLYETNEDKIQSAADAAGTDIETAYRLLRTPTNLAINIGFGASNPAKRVERISLVTRITSEFAPDLVMQMDRKELISELYGAVGLDSGRFFPSLRQAQQEDPRIKQLEQQLAEMQQAIETKQIERATRLEVAQIGASTQQQRIQADVQMFQMKQQLDARFRAMEHAVAQEKARIDNALKIEQADVTRRQLLLQREALNKAILDGEREYQLTLHQMGLLPAAPTPDNPQPVPRLTGSQGSLPGSVNLSSPAVNLPGDDRGGVISRDRYGDVPFAAQ